MIGTQGVRTLMTADDWFETKPVGRRGAAVEVEATCLATGLRFTLLARPDGTYSSMGGPGYRDLRFALLWGRNAAVRREARYQDAPVEDLEAWAERCIRQRVDLLTDAERA